MQSFNLNLVPGGFKPVFNASQYGVGRQFSAVIFDGSLKYTIPTGSVVKIEATKPSGFGFSVNATFSGSTVTVVTTATMTDEWGRFPVELVISKDGTILGTANFTFDIEKSPHPEGTTDGDAPTIINQLTELVQEIEASNSKVETMTVSATRLPYNQQPTVSYDPDTNNMAFGIPSGGDLECTDPDGDGNIVITFS